MEKEISLISIIPFILMLASIALLPVVAQKFWNKNNNKLLVAIVFSIPSIIWLIAENFYSQLLKTIFYDYIPFIILIGTFFIITGGIFIEGDIEAKPKTNTVFLAISSILASLIGTAGAALLMIRPLLHTNKERKLKTHTVLFFIAIAANCGGLSSPVGNPPLFLMYLRGVSFFWFFKFVPMWLFVNGLLLIIYFIIDSYYWSKETEENRNREQKYQRKISIEGKLNFIWLIGALLAVALINKSTISAMNEYPSIGFIREIILILMAYCSIKFTPRMTRISNSFTWRPIEEISYLFLGIFITMIPCLLVLEQNAGKIDISSNAGFYYLTGFLSSFLDNAPTALSFYSLSLGKTHALATNPDSIVLIAGIPESIMKSICAGATFFGAMTYIGNSPNFMIKSIAEHHNIKLPHFFAYMFKFSLIILLPVYILAQILFL